MQEFTAFRDGPAAQVCQRVFNVDITKASSWGEFHAIIERVRAVEGANFLDRIKVEVPRLSSSEKAIAVATVDLVGFQTLADELAEGFFRLLRECSGTQRAAVLTILATKDRR